MSGGEIVIACSLGAMIKKQETKRCDVGCLFLSKQVREASAADSERELKRKGCLGRVVHGILCKEGVLLVRHLKARRQRQRRAQDRMHGGHAVMNNIQEAEVRKTGEKKVKNGVGKWN